MSPLFALLVALVRPPGAPPPPHMAAGPRLFTEADGRRAVVTLEGDRSSRLPAVFVSPGQVAAGLEWGPVYVVVNAGLVAPDTTLCAGLRGTF